MKLRSTAGVSFALVLAASAASAAGGKETTVKGEKGGTEKGAGETTTSTTGTTGTAGAEREKDKVSAKAQEKTWTVGAAWEAHAMLVQNDLEGAAPAKYFHYYYLFGSYEPWKNNRFTLRAGMSQFFLADPEESGLRLDDIYGAYTHVFPLPKDFRLSVTGSLIAPTSFVSHKEGLITAPRLTFQLDRDIGKWVSVSARLFGEVDIQQYASFENGSLPNPIARTGGSLAGEVTMPFHDKLSMGAALFTGYTWFYDAYSTTPALTGYPAGTSPVQQDPNFQHQPTQQSYGGEVYARYTLPRLVGVKTDVRVALAEGDQSILHDGVTHFYLFYRLAGQFYGALTVRY